MFVCRDGMLSNTKYVEWLSDVKYMKQWYLFYYKNIMKGQQLVGQIETSEKCQQLVDILGKTEKKATSLVAKLN